MGFSRFESLTHFARLLMSISREELRKMVVEHPSLLKVSFFFHWTLNSKTPAQRDDSLVLSCFEVLHCEAGIPHHILAHFPTALTAKPLEVTLSALHCEKIQLVVIKTIQVAERHQFLTSLGRAQYDPGKPQYVSPTALTEGSDLEFVEKVARSTIQLYNAFLKTL